MNNKEKYRKFCEDEETIPLFCKDWWLDSVCGDEWDVCLVEEKNEIVAAMPYVMKKKFGLHMIRQPTLTQNLGPWFKKTSKNYSKDMSVQNKYMLSLIKQFPKFHYFKVNFHYDNANWLPFYWSGFEQTTKYTYLLTDLTDLEEVFSRFSSSYRGKVRKASKLVSVELSLDIESFFLINKKTFNRQGINVPYSLEWLKRHDEILSKKNAREIFYAIDNDGNLHSALYLTWDSESAYVHMVGEDPEYRKSGAGILLIWEAIKYTKNTLGLKKFDFEGSMLESVERVRRDCGGIQTPYHCITKINSKMIVLKKMINELM